MAFELRTPRLLLRDLCDDDFEVVHSYASDPEVVQFMDWGPNAEADTKGFLQLAATTAAARPRTSFELAVVEPSSNTLLGAAGISVDASGTQAMLGYCFARNAWGRGVATEAAQALLHFGFTELKVHRIWASCDPDNVRSRRVLEKLALSPEGHLRENLFIRSTFRDSLLFAILRHEWEIAQTYPRSGAT